MLKVYSLIYDFSLCTPIEVDGKVISVVFSGGSKAIRQNGEFCTTDERLQEAIEKSSGYGQVYKLKKTFPIKLDNAKEKVNEILEEKICATVNEAIEWLVELGCKKYEVNTSAKAIEKAREMGFELKFEKGE